MRVSCNRTKVIMRMLEVDQSSMSDFSYISDYRNNGDNEMNKIK